MGFYDSWDIERLRAKRVELQGERRKLETEIESIHMQLQRYVAGSVESIRAADAGEYRLRDLRGVNAELATINARVGKLSDKNNPAYTSDVFNLLVKGIKLKFGNDVAEELVKEAHRQHQAVMQFRSRTCS